MPPQGDHDLGNPALGALAPHTDAEGHDQREPESLPALSNHWVHHLVHVGLQQLGTNDEEATKHVSEAQAYIRTPIARDTTSLNILPIRQRTTTRTLRRPPSRKQKGED